MKNYDAIIIGAGQAGTPLAKKLALAGKKTCLIEKRAIGGTCINDGCTPTKTMIASAKAAYYPAIAKKLGVDYGTIKIDYKAIIKRKDDLVKRFRESAEKGVEETKGLTLVFGEATFSGEKEITIKNSAGEEEVITGEWIFINTGTTPFIPDIDGLEEVEYLTSTTLLDLPELPEHLVILGGNYIGLEFGQMYSRFGSKVTILEQADRLLTREDEDIAESVTNFLKVEGINILTKTEIVSVAKDKSGKLNLNLISGSKTSSLKCSHLLIATGRKPLTGMLNLSFCGVKTDPKGAIIVNDKLETNVKNIWALGDVKGGPAFTHISYNDYTIVYRNLIEKAKLTIKGRPVPYCMFTDPQLGRIGLTENEAKEQKLNYEVAMLPMEYVARGIETGETLGVMKAIVDKKTKKILGAAMLSDQGGEIMSVLQMAMDGGITYDKIRYGVFAHPTYSESLNNLFMKLDT